MRVSEFAVVYYYSSRHLVSGFGLTRLTQSPARAHHHPCPHPILFRPDTPHQSPARTHHHPCPHPVSDFALTSLQMLLEQQEKEDAEDDPFAALERYAARDITGKHPVPHDPFYVPPVEPTGMEDPFYVPPMEDEEPPMPVPRPNPGGGGGGGARRVSFNEGANEVKLFGLTPTKASDPRELAASLRNKPKPVSEWPSTKYQDLRWNQAQPKASLRTRRDPARHGLHGLHPATRFLIPSRPTSARSQPGQKRCPGRSGSAGGGRRGRRGAGGRRRGGQRVL